MPYRGDRQVQLRKSLKISQTALAARVGCSRFGLIKWEKGESQPRSDSVKLVAQELHTSVEYLTGLSDDPATNNDNEIPQDKGSKLLDIDNLLMVPIISPEVRICAGTGNEYPSVEWEVQGKFPIYDGHLAALYREDSLLCMYVEGDSMEPQIHNGDIVLFDHDSHWISGNVYVVCLDGRMMVKGLIFNGQGKPPILRSLNKEYMDIVVGPDSSFLVYGRVLMITTSRSPRFLL